LNKKKLKSLGKLGKTFDIIGKPLTNEFLEGDFVIFRLKVGGYIGIRVIVFIQTSFKSYKLDLEE